MSKFEPMYEGVCVAKSCYNRGAKHFNKSILAESTFLEIVDHEGVTDHVLQLYYGNSATGAATVAKLGREPIMDWICSVYCVGPKVGRPVIICPTSAWILAVNSLTSGTVVPSKTNKTRSMLSPNSFSMEQDLPTKEGADLYLEVNTAGDLA